MDEIETKARCAEYCQGKKAGLPTLARIKITIQYKVPGLVMQIELRNKLLPFDDLV